MWKNISIFVYFILILTACNQSESEALQNAVTDYMPTSDKNPYVKITRSAKGYLSEDYARRRSQQVDNVSYRLSVELSDKEPEFKGIVEISFDLLTNKESLTIDFSEGTINNISLNDKPIAYDYNNWFITIDKSHLDTGRQKIVINYSHPYSSTGSGLYRFTDPEDDRTYLYSDFEPYDANRFFPCFDQPDIKANFELMVEVPDTWHVITYNRESEIINLSDRRRWIFPQSDKLSTYVFSLHAGPYHIWHAQAGGISLRLMARQSLKKYVDAKEWLEITQQGFEYYQHYFDIPYPFYKYDQLIVPDLNSGAMENVAAVTFTERLIRRGSYTSEEKELLASVILHEMSHMWFGNLVTMKWWNGLWLNESFATYMAYLALVENTRYKHAWHRFYTHRKLWAYDTDEQVTNHPIELPVDNTDSGFANFDGITYGKGASVLKQLSYLLGKDNFRQGVGKYLKDKSYGNSKLSDFISALEKSADKDLEQWTNQWLYKKGMNTVMADYHCNDGKLTKLQIIQKATGVPPYFRVQRMQVALFNRNDDGKIVIREKIPVVISDKITNMSNVSGMDCPDLVYPNYDDWAFVKVRMGEQELDTISNHINSFENALLRSMLWRNLWEGVRDAYLPLNHYTEIILINIAKETNKKILEQVLKTIPTTLNYMYQFDGVWNELTRKYNDRLEELIWLQVNLNKMEKDLQKIWFDNYIEIVHSTDGLGRIDRLIKGETLVEGLELDQDRRWRILIKLSDNAYPGIEELLKYEMTRDLSDNAEKSHITAQAAIPTLENKKKWLNYIQAKQTKEISLANHRAAMQSLLPKYYPEFTKALLNDVLNPLGLLDKNREQQYLRHYTRNLIHGYCRSDSINLLQHAIKENKESSSTITKELKIALQEDQRCLKIKSLVDM